MYQTNAVVIGGPAGAVAVGEGIAGGGIGTAVSGLFSIVTTGAPLPATTVATSLLTGAATGGTTAVATTAAASTAAVTGASVSSAPAVVTMLSGPVGWALLGTVVVGAASIDEPFNEAASAPLAALAGSFFLVTSSTVAYVTKIRKTFRKNGNVFIYVQAIILLCIALCLAW